MSAGLNGIIFDDFEWPKTRVPRSLYTYKSNISKTVRFRDKVTKEHYRMVPGTTFNDLEWPLTTISRSRHFSTLNIRIDMRWSHSYYRTSIGSHMRFKTAHMKSCCLTVNHTRKPHQSIRSWHFWSRISQIYFYGQSFYRTLIGNHTSL